MLQSWPCKLSYNRAIYSKSNNTFAILAEDRCPLYIGEHLLQQVQAIVVFGFIMVIFDLEDASNYDSYFYIKKALLT